MNPISLLVALGLVSSALAGADSGGDDAAIRAARAYAMAHQTPVSAELGTQAPFVGTWTLVRLVGLAPPASPLYLHYLVSADRVVMGETATLDILRRELGPCTTDARRRQCYEAFLRACSPFDTVIIDHPGDIPGYAHRPLPQAQEEAIQAPGSQPAGPAGAGCFTYFTYTQVGGEVCRHDVAFDEQGGMTGSSSVTIATNVGDAIWYE